MYPGKIVTGTAVTSGGALAVTGHNSMWLVIGGLTLILAGLAIVRLVPKRRRVRGG
ncbi:hypothetical protein ACFQS1_19885 [Paractinoplanes rhizophilus]|uniref:LPXTG-motif cell wall anchor domain-containing protein n=1 Tax=Paractinoplanes rhizophilus TaxID=1416877 RepID=A0ABW2HXE9_9ACTN